jgi:hypothetical protein
MGWLKDIFSRKTSDEERNQLHRRAQRAESDAIHLMRLNQNLQMRLDYAVEKIRDLKKFNSILLGLYGATNSEPMSASDPPPTSSGKSGPSVEVDTLKEDSTVAG